jgi:hypothetical protein
VGRFSKPASGEEASTNLFDLCAVLSAASLRSLCRGVPITSTDMNENAHFAQNHQA